MLDTRGGTEQHTVEVPPISLFLLNCSTFQEELSKQAHRSANKKKIPTLDITPYPHGHWPASASAPRGATGQALLYRTARIETLASFCIFTCRVSAFQKFCIPLAHCTNEPLQGIPGRGVPSHLHCDLQYHMWDSFLGSTIACLCTARTLFATLSWTHVIWHVICLLLTLSNTFQQPFLYRTQLAPDTIVVEISIQCC